MRHRLILFATYNKWGRSNENTIEEIKELCKEAKKDKSKVVVLCNHWEIDTKLLVRIQKLCTIEFYTNQWYDFGMYYSYFNKYKQDIAKYDKILLMNDSILIVKPLDWVFKRLNKQKAEYIGINEWYIDSKSINDYKKFMLKDNKQRVSPFKNWKHIESRFLQLSGRAKELLKELVQEGVPELKEQIIFEFELRWYQLAVARRYTIKAYNEVLLNRNICYELPLYMIEHWLPFVKKNFNNYWYKRMFKPVIEYLASEIYINKHLS